MSNFAIFRQKASQSKVEFFRHPAIFSTVFLKMYKNTIISFFILDQRKLALSPFCRQEMFVNNQKQRPPPNGGGRCLALMDSGLHQRSSCSRPTLR